MKYVQLFVAMSINCFNGQIFAKPIIYAHYHDYLASTSSAFDQPVSMINIDGLSASYWIYMSNIVTHIARFWNEKLYPNRTIHIENLDGKCSVKD